jgi:hypothetical protein
LGSDKPALSGRTSLVIFGQDFRINRILGGGAACFHPVYPEILSKKIKNPVQKTKNLV